MSAGQPDVFKPSVWRYARFRYVRLLGAYLLLAAAGVALRGLGAVDGTVLALLLGVFAVAALIGELLRARMKVPALYIRFAAERIDGPASEFGKRVSFPVERIDAERTRRPDVWRRLTGRYTIWSLDGESIRLEASGFAPDDVQAILARIGCAPPD
jgi:hypothetical protein